METAITAIRKTLAAAAAVLVSAVACSTAENLTAAQKLDRVVDKLGQQTSHPSSSGSTPTPPP
ncbi:hypothetical protein [Streptomyces sp. NPDC057413]|uniref:hypothetical protein n=1 Tax=Streptomyces sp. NPDC057413 TaxID=3346124 RepID=UPI003676C72C